MTPLLDSVTVICSSVTLYSRSEGVFRILLCGEVGPAIGAFGGEAMNERVSICELGPQNLCAAANLTAQAMLDNPLDIAAFGADAARRARRMQRMFRVALPMIHRKGYLLGAFEGAVLVGVAASVPSNDCQPSTAEKAILAPRMFRAVGPAGFMRMLRWTQSWAAHDDGVPHWHLGPVAVDADRQGKGIGSALLAEYCKRLDQASANGYLETDKVVNMRFYARFGFAIVTEARVLDIPNWFMRRVPAVAGDDGRREVRP
jgi:GNAT superfamily N-acetyltransferase